MLKAVLHCQQERHIVYIFLFSLHYGNRKVKHCLEEAKMKESVYKTYEELPLFLNAKMVAQVLGIAPSSTYELMHESSFPVLKIGSRMVVPKEKFIEWVERNTGGDS